MAVPIRAYLLIETLTGESDSILEGLNAIEQTIQADRVTGPFDIICVLETESLNEIGDIVRDKVHSLEGVVRTMSCMSIGE